MLTSFTKKDITQEMIVAVTNYINKRAFAETMTAEVSAIQKDILANEIALYNDLETKRSRFGHTAQKQRITDSKHTYLSEDEEVIQKYYKLCDSRLRESGLKPADMEFDYCPMLVARTEQTKAEWGIMDAAAKMLKLYMSGKDLNNGLLCKGLEARQEFIDLSCNLVMSL